MTRLDFIKEMQSRDKTPDEIRNGLATLSFDDTEPAAPKDDSFGAAAMPRTSALTSEASIPKIAGAAASDILSLPGRALASLPRLAKGGEGFREALARKGGEKDEGRVANFAEDIVRDPATLTTMAVGGPILKAADKLPLNSIKSAALRALGKGAAVGGGEGIVSASTHAAENVGEGKPVDWKAAAGEIAASGAIPAMGGGLFKGANTLLKKYVPEVAGPSLEALQTAGTKEGRTALKEASGKSYQLGGEILSDIQNIDSKLPNAQKVQAIVKGLPPSKPDALITKLTEGKYGEDTALANDYAKEVNKAIDEMKQGIVNVANKNNGTLPAPFLRDLKISLDDEVAKEFGKDSSPIVSIKKQLRHTIADELVNSADASGHPEYADMMKDYRTKLQLADQLKSYLGKNPESFVNNLFGANKTQRQEAVKALGEIFGKDYLEQSKMVRLAKELGPSGETTWLPTATTGRSLLGMGAVTAAAHGATGPLAAIGAPIATALTASPKIASRVTLPIAESAANGQGGIRQSAARAFRAATRTGIGQDETQDQGE
jgi:hypothetical protein